MSENQLVLILPEEIREIAVKVPADKQKEVETVLNQIFSGTADWERQVDAIEVKDINDVMSIRLADTARKNAKNARLSAEKVFDAKREEVQSRMMNDKIEDSLWLKSKQIMQLKFKHIEEKAEYKAKFAERFEAEQKELRTQIRIEKVAKFKPELNRFEFENMSNEMFDIFISGLEKEHNDKIEAANKTEAERIAKEKAEKEEQERIRIENEKLKKEAEAKQKELEKERAKVEVERKAAEEKARKEKELADARLKTEQEAKAKLEAELKAKVEAERKAKELKEAEEKAAKIAADKAAKAPKKQKLNLWVNSFTIVSPVGLESDKTTLDIIEKFNSFKKWAAKQIENI